MKSCSADIAVCTWAAVAHLCGSAARASAICADQAFAQPEISEGFHFATCVATASTYFARQPASFITMR